MFLYKNTPIAKGIKSLMEPLGEQVDLLQGLVQSLPGYIRDTGAVFAQLDGVEWMLLANKNKIAEYTLE